MNISQYENGNIMGRLNDLNEWIEKDKLYVRSLYYFAHEGENGFGNHVFYLGDEYLVFDAMLQDGKILLGIGTGDVGEEFYIDFESEEFEIFVKD